MRSLVISTVIIGFALPAFAQSVGSDVQRNVDQQQRIQQGLQSGQLSSGEAGRLERGQQRIDNTEARDLRNGSLSPAERAQITRMDNRQSAAIYNAKHNSVLGNPGSASSERLQADVQRNVNQQTRIENGIQNGSLTNRETGALERGQGRVDARETNSAANGWVGPREQSRIQTAQNFQSGRIFALKHNGRTR